MKKVFQTIVDKDNGNCMPACVCSLLNLDNIEVPNFFDDGVDSFHQVFEKMLKENGYKLRCILYNPKQTYLYFPTQGCFEKVRLHEPALFSNIDKYVGVDGYFIAAVLSPAYFDYQENLHQTHAVICDKNFNIVHDPNPNNANILEYPLAKLIDYNGIINVYIIEKK